MASSLRPRHPADIAADAAAARRRLGQKIPPQLFRGQRRLMIAAIPAIITAAGVYIMLVLVDRMIQKHPFFAKAPETASDEVLVRGVDGVVHLPPVEEQAPPPSPDLIAEQAEQARRERSQQASATAAEVAIPVLEPDPILLEPAPAATLLPGTGGAPEVSLPEPPPPSPTHGRE